jgi:hypothetical protein
MTACFCGCGRAVPRFPLGIRSVNTRGRLVAERLAWARAIIGDDLDSTWLDDGDLILRDLRAAVHREIDPRALNEGSIREWQRVGGRVEAAVVAAGGPPIKRLACRTVIRFAAAVSPVPSVSVWAARSSGRGPDRTAPRRPFRGRSRLSRPRAGYPPGGVAPHLRGWSADKKAMLARSWLALVSSVIFLAGCGGEEQSAHSRGGSGAGASAEQSTHTPNADAVNADAVRLLESWRPKLVKVVMLQRDRAKAFEAGDFGKAARHERRVLRNLRPMEKWGRQARTTFIDAARSRVTRATIRAGDAWSEWAYTTRTDPPRGDFAKAQHIADLAAVGLRRSRQAYRSAGEPLPPEFQTRQ